MARSKKIFRRNQGLKPLSRDQYAVGLGSEIFKTVEIRKIWVEVVGKSIAEVTFVQKCIKGKLYILVEHGGWAYQLTLLKPNILEKLKKYTQYKITDVQWVQSQSLPENHKVKHEAALRHKFKQQKNSAAQGKETIDALLARVREKHIKLK